MRRVLPLAAALALLVASCPAAAEIILDREAPLTWEDALACERVVVARYEGHEGTTLRLKVERVLKGSGVAAGDVLPVALEHWYRLVVDPEPAGTMLRRDAEGLPPGPWLCYLRQVVNPGLPVPVRILPSARSSAIYFLPKASAPALVRHGQVQPPWLADGWEATLKGATADVTWRAAQWTDRRVAHAALEELASSRDPAAIDRLFDRTRHARENRGPWWPYPWEEPSGERELRAIGDRKGDVYDRALSLLDDPATKQHHAEFAMICAACDPARAVRDLSARIASDRPWWIRTAAVDGLGVIGSAQALDVLLVQYEGDFDLGRTPDPTQGIRTALWLQGSWGIRRTVAEVARLRAVALPRLEAIAASGTPFVRQQVGPLLHGLREAQVETSRPSPEDAARAVANVTRRAQPADESSSRIVRAMESAPSGDFVLGLVRALAANPPRAGLSYPFREVLFLHALLCRRAMRVACEAAGVFDPSWPADDPHEVRSLREWLGLPPAYGSRWVLRDLDERRVPDPKALQSLMRSDAETARGLVARALAQGIPKHLSQQTTAEDRSRWPGILALGIGQGRKDLVPALVEAVRVRMDAERAEGSVPSSPLLLLETGDPDAFTAYLAILDELPLLATWRGRIHGDYGRERLLVALASASPREFMKRVAPTLESDDPYVREAGSEALRSALTWQVAPHGWEWEVAVRREPWLAAARPVLDSVAEARDEVGARAALLRALGSRLEGEPGPAWIASLRTAVRSLDPSVADNAVWLVGAVLGEPDVAEAVARIRPPDRPRAINVWLADRGR